MFEYNLSFRDIAMAEVHLKHGVREVKIGIDEVEGELTKMDVTLESIREPNRKVIKEVQEYGENFSAEMNRVIAGLDAMKAAILKSEADHSAYDEVLAEIRKTAQQDLKEVTRQGAAQAPKVYM